ncbi:UNVERIFIED_CONTAM: Polymerase delta-interacting protein 2 [Trichonephila clavipes]
MRIMNKIRHLSFITRFENSLLNVICNPIIVFNARFARLAEVGKLETPKLEGKYDTGQLFLHRIFGYRGVTLFPYMACVYDRDVPNQETNRESEESSINYNHIEKEVISHTHTYYQVLIDSRDCPFVRTQTEAVTVLGNQDNSRSLYAIPGTYTLNEEKCVFISTGLDYVAHEDVIPYTSTEKQPISHELFDKFLMHDPEKDPPFSARETLRAWQEKNHPWLELSTVHKQTTENIRVTVIPFYMGQRVSWDCICELIKNLIN